MESQSKNWLPLTEYALRSGMSISTLRRKIKSNSISYKMEDGRYLIQSDDLPASMRTIGFVSSDAPAPHHHSIPTTRPMTAEKESPAPAVFPVARTAEIPNMAEELEKLRTEHKKMRDEDVLRWRALEARVAGLAKQLEFFSEQIAEAKMLVKIFEEKLDHRA